MIAEEKAEVQEDIREYNVVGSPPSKLLSEASGAPHLLTVGHLRYSSSLSLKLDKT